MAATKVQHPVRTCLDVASSVPEWRCRCIDRQLARLEGQEAEFSHIKTCQADTECTVGQPLGIKMDRDLFMVWHDANRDGLVRAKAERWERQELAAAQACEAEVTTLAL